MEAERTYNHSFAYVAELVANYRIYDVRSLSLQTLVEFAQEVRVATEMPNGAALSRSLPRYRLFALAPSTALW